MDNHWQNSRGGLQIWRRGGRVYPAAKALLEWCAAAMLMLIVGPVIAVLGGLVKLTSPGPAFYTQTRLGRGGRPFRIWKLRTMTHDCEKLTGPVWAAANDCRVTPLGQLMRDTHLDELPQLWNILRGDMSLIGPRPERPEIAKKIEAVLPEFRLRLLVRPGLTGLAQLRVPPDTDIDQVGPKLGLDLYYLQHQTLLVDLRIFISTAFNFMGTGCACASRLMLTTMRSELPRLEFQPDVTAEHASDRLPETARVAA